MKTLFIALMFCLISVFLKAQGLVEGPECVEFDELRNQYIVSNSTAGDIVIIDSLGNQSYFVTGNPYTNGIYLAGDTLWIVCSFPNKILAYDLETSNLLAYIPDVLGARAFDAMVFDTSGNAYVTVCEEYSHQGRIFKLDISDYSWSILADSGIYHPQAIRFDAEENAIIFCSCSNNPARIQKITLNDTVLTNLVESSTALWMDGIAFDEFGYTYVSSWDQDGIFRFDSEFTDPPEQIAFGFDGPTALCYNKRDHILAAPDFLQNRVEFIELHVTVERDTTWGWPPFEVSFIGSSEHNVDTWEWDFGDGMSDYIQSPTHVYQNPGIFDITLNIDIGDDNTLTRFLRHDILVLADTLSASRINAEPNSIIEVVISATNSIPLNSLEIPVEYSGPFGLTLQSFSTEGCRTDVMQHKEESHGDPYFKRSTFRIYSDFPNPMLEPGSGPVLKLYLRTPPALPSGAEVVLSLDGYQARLSEFTGYDITYTPYLIHGSIAQYVCGDASGDTNIDLIDILYMIDNLYGDSPGPSPIPLESGDANADGAIDLIDILYLISFRYDDPPGPEPQCP